MTVGKNLVSRLLLLDLFQDKNFTQLFGNAIFWGAGQ
jgi:hypothetical protein